MLNQIWDSLSDKLKPDMVVHAFNLSSEAGESLSESNLICIVKLCVSIAKETSKQLLRTKKSDCYKLLMS